LKLRDLQRHLRAHGATIARDRGNHTIWTLSSHTAPVPRHREIAPAIAIAICKQLGIPQATQPALIAAAGVRCSRPMSAAEPPLP